MAAAAASRPFPAAAAARAARAHLPPWAAGASGQPNTATERSEAMTPRETTTRRGTTTRSARAVREHTDPPAPGWRRVLLHVVGSGLLIATGAINLDLYLTGYRAIPAIGRLFLLQAIAAVGLARAVPAILSRLVIVGCLHPRRLPAVGLDGAVRVHRGPHDRPHRRRRGGGGRFRGAGIVPGTSRLGAAS